MSLKVYLAKRALIYMTVFIVAITLVWALVRFAPGDPALTSVMRTMIAPGVRYTEEQIAVFRQRAIEMLGLNLPLHEQYLLFWKRLLTGDWGWSSYSSAPVLNKLLEIVSYDLLLIVPAILTSWFIGNWLGAIAARNRMADRILVPIMYILTATPHFLFGLVMVYLLGVVYNVFKPVITTTDIQGLFLNPSWGTLVEFLKAYTLPFISLVLVSMGGWASGMRTLMTYELESNYARYMESLGFSNRTISSYAFRYAINPQVTGLGIQIGTVIVAGLALSSIFNYPGAGINLIYAINYRDVFLIQGIAIFYTLMVILASFIIDLVYVIVDPRLRLGLTG